jgi:hypothetical protein
MIAFVSAHLKHIVTAGFIIGVLSLLVRYLDDKLSEEKKKEFGRWIENKTLQVDDVTLQSLYIVGRKHRRLFASTVAGSSFAIFALTFPKDTFDRNETVTLWTVQPICALMLFVAVQKLFSESTFRRSFAETWLKVRTVVMTVPLFIFIDLLWTVFQKRSIRTELDDFRKSGYALFSPQIDIIFGLFPLLLIFLLRAPILALSKALWWIASHPKGPWGGLVAALTLILGLLRLFM